MIRRHVLLALAAGALLLVGCADIPNGSPGTTTPPPSGVRGTVILGPTCPIGGEPGASDPIPCLTPYVARLVVVDSQGEVVTQVSSDADGHFEVTLPPGEYVITPTPPASGDPFPVAQPLSVVVVAGEYLEVQINYDTGIR